MASKHYSIISKWDEEHNLGGEISFETDCKELYEMVLDFVDVCADAINYRNSLERQAARLIDPKLAYNE